MFSRTRPTPSRRGVVAVKVALCLPLLVSIVALALEGSLMYDNRRRAQATADAAALAAAADLFATYTNAFGSDDGKDLTGSIAAHAKAVAAANGYTDDKTNTTVTVNIPPQAGDAVGKDGYAEVLVQFNQRRGFSSIFGSGVLPVPARAVARGQWSPNSVGILVTDPTGSGSLSINGNGLGYTPNAPVIVNSTASDAVTASGTGCTLTAKSYEVTGGVQLNNSGNLVGPLNTGVPPTPDPFRFLLPPNPFGMTSQTLKQATVVNAGGGAKTYYLQPGVYDGGLSFSGQESVVMAPGIYYMRGGGFKFSGNVGTSLTATGVMLYNAPDVGGSTTNTDISITGSATVTWTPPTSGPYQGMALWQARGLTTTATMFRRRGHVDLRGLLLPQCNAIGVRRRWGVHRQPDRRLPAVHGRQRGVQLSVEPAVAA